MEEIWKDIVGYEGYYKVSNLGRVKSLERTNNIYNKKEKILKLVPRAKNSLYLCVSLSKDSKVKLSSIHSIVMAAFVGERLNGNVINHIDGNPSNNILENLEYCTQSHNKKEDFRCGRQSYLGEKNNSSKLTEKDVLDILKLKTQTKIGYGKISKMYNVSRSGIANIFNGHTWTHITNIKNKYATL